MTVANNNQSPAAETTRKEAPGVVSSATRRYLIDPTTVTMDPAWNNRIEMGDIDSLALSIVHELARDPKSGGLLEEIGVRRLKTDDPLSQGGKFHFCVVWGHRRTTAIHRLQSKGTAFNYGIPAKIVDKSQDIQASMIQMIAENSQKPLLPLEEAAAYKKLRDGFPEQGIKGMTIKQICAAVGKASMHVTEMLGLLDADDSVKEGLKDGTLGKTDAKQIAKHAKGDKKKQAELVAAARDAKKNGKGGKAKVKAAIEGARQTKAKNAGRTLKIRALSNEQLSELGATQAQEMVKKMTEAGKKPDFNVRDWISKDEALALAFTFGTLEALKAAAGQSVNLAI